MDDSAEVKNDYTEEDSIASFENDLELSREAVKTKGLIHKAQRLINSVQQVFRTLEGTNEDHGMLNHYLYQSMKLLRKARKDKIKEKKTGLLNKKRVPYDKTWIVRCEKEKTKDLLTELYSDGRVTRHSLLTRKKQGGLESIMIETHSRTTFEKLRKEASIEPVNLKDFFKEEDSIDAADIMQIRVRDLAVDFAEVIRIVLKRDSINVLIAKTTLERKMELVFNHLKQKSIKECNVSAFIYGICVEIAIKDRLNIVGFEYPLTEDTKLDGLLYINNCFIIIENKLRKKSSGRKDTYNRGYAEKLLARFPETEMLIGLYFSYTLTNKRFQLVIEVISISEDKEQKDRMLIDK